MLRFHSLWLASLAAVAALHAPAELAAQDARFELGVRGLILLGKGAPANDMVGQGLVGRWRLSDAWRLGIALDGATFDYETPNRALGIPAVAIVDGTNEWQRTSVFVERRFEGERRWDWHWLAGVGKADVDAIGDVAGLRAGGGAFDITTTADDELHVFAGGGLHRALGQRWLLDTSLTIEHHDTDYQLTDRLSGARGVIGSQWVYGIAIGVSYGF
jgi:hypothetical protein